MNRYWIEVRRIYSDGRAATRWRPLNERDSRVYEDEAEVRLTLDSLRFEASRDYKNDPVVPDVEYRLCKTTVEVIG